MYAAAAHVDYAYEHENRKRIAHTIASSLVVCVRTRNNYCYYRRRCETGRGHGLSFFRAPPYTIILYAMYVCP
jgi:hypothetical protein